MRRLSGLSVFVSAVALAGCAATGTTSTSAVGGIATAAPSIAPTLPLTPAPSLTPGTSPAPSQDATTYVVRKGDTLTAIAKRLHVTLRALQAANPQVKDPTKLQIGDKLVIPKTGA